MKKYLLLLMLILISTVPITAQSTPMPTMPDVALTFPPPVYVLTGEVDLVGTANLSDQSFYFLEYQPLGDDLLPRDGARTLWFPATLPTQTPVIDSLLGAWDTTTAPDGLYALRLTVNTNDGETVYAISSPLRIDNSEVIGIGRLDEDDDINNALLALTATAEAGGGITALATVSPNTNTLEATPTAFADGTLTAEVVVLANLRQGDSTLFAIESGLEPGTMLTVLGQSTRGNNWLLVETANGERGWVAPSVVTLDGSIVAAPPINPPQPPVTPTPTQPPIPDLPDAIVSSVEVDRELRQGEAFQIIVSISNTGRTYLQDSTLFCNVEPMNTSVAIVAGNLQAGTSTRVALPLRLDSGGNQNVNIICKIDMNEEIREINENNNIGNLSVFLNS